MKNIWIAVADAAQARILEYRPHSPRRWREVDTMVWPEARSRGTELSSDGPGSSGCSGGRRTALSQSTDPHENEKCKSARALCEHLDKAATTHEMEALMLVAPPRYLGLLRDNLSTPTRSCLVGTINKDYTHLSTHDLPAALEPQMPRRI